jgi:hypothetical protein
MEVHVDPVTLSMIPAFVGGLLIALVIHRLQRSYTIPPGVDPLAREPITTDVINMARIRVAGIGGLGLVAMAVVVALFVPRIGESMAIGLLAGAVFAVILVFARGRHL